MVTVEAQAMVVAFVASMLAQTLGWITNGNWKVDHAIVLCAGSLLTGAIASGLLGMFALLQYSLHLFHYDRKLLWPVGLSMI